MEVCRNCQKYVFDRQNINRHKRMTVLEYVNGVIRRLFRTNETARQICARLGWEESFYVNRSYCELCGAPHAVFSYKSMDSVVRLAYFFSGNDKPCEKDVRFIDDFRRKFLAG